MDAGEMLVTGVAKAWSNQGIHTRYHTGKKYWTAYGYDVDGNFKTKKISTAQAIILKRRVKKLIKVQCSQCGAKFNAIKQKAIPHCPSCT